MVDLGRRERGVAQGQVDRCRPAATALDALSGPPPAGDLPVLWAVACALMLRDDVIQGQLEFLRKPFSPGALAGKVRAVLDA